METVTKYTRKDVKNMIKRLKILRISKTDLFKRNAASRTAIDDMLNGKVKNVTTFNNILKIIEKEEKKLKKILDGIK